MSVVIGIDPGSFSLGFSLVSGDSSSRDYRLLDSGVCCPNRSWPLYRRLSFIYDYLMLKIKDMTPDVLCLEKAFYGLNVKTALALGSVRGVVMCLVGQLDIDFEEYSPSEVKKAIVGHGHARKDQIRYMASHFVEGEFKTDKSDESDATGIALCYFLKKKHSLSFPRLKGARSSGQIGNAKIIER